jgi:TIR domain
MPSVKRTTNPLEVFYSYSHKDEALRNELETHLALLKRAGVITGWHDRKITAGSEWKGKISEHLNSAKVILLLISSDFLASDYCYDVETKRALWRHFRGLVRVIPVILRACDWHIAPLSKLQALPTDGTPITSWSNKDEAFTNVAKGIREAIREITSPTPAGKSPSKSKPAAPVRDTPVVSKQPQSKTKVAPARAAAGKTTTTSPAEKPVNPRVRSAGNTPAKRGAVTPPVVESLPRDVVASQIDEAFRKRPKASLGVAWLQIAWASIRADSALRPTLFADADFRHTVQEIAHAGKPPLFPFGTPNDVDYSTSRLQVIQQHVIRGGRGGQDFIELTLYANGAVAVAMNVTNLKDRDMYDFAMSMRINPDDVQTRLEQAWSFASRWWKYRFRSQGSSNETLLYNVGLFDTENYKFEKPPQGGRTNSVSLSMRTRPNPVMAHDAPKLISRSVLTKPGGEIADLIKMLEMRFDEADRWR